jgi:Uma2 family endonuclease
MPVALRKLYSEEDYLFLERAAKTKSEFYRGEIFAMSGASFQHNQIASNIGGEIRNLLKGKRYNIYGSDLRVHTQLNSFYTYPDATVICGDPTFIDREFDTVINPTVLFEILSPSTAEYDRTIKFDFYKKIPSLKEYVLIDSQSILVQLYTKQVDKNWLITELKEIDTKLHLTSIEISISLKEIYSDVKFT